MLTQEEQEYEEDMAICDDLIKNASDSKTKEAYKKLKYALIVMKHKEDKEA